MIRFPSLPPLRRGVAIALYYTSSYSGYLACLLTSHRDMMGSVSGGGSEGAGPLDVPVAASLIASVAMASTVLVVLRNRLVTNKSGGGAQPQWRPWNNLQDTKEVSSPPFNSPRREMPLSTARSPTSPQSLSIPNQSRKLENSEHWAKTQCVAGRVKLDGSHPASSGRERRHE